MTRVSLLGGTFQLSPFGWFVAVMIGVPMVIYRVYLKKYSYKGQPVTLIQFVNTVGPEQRPPVKGIKQLLKWAGRNGFIASILMGKEVPEGSPLDEFCY